MVSFLQRAESTSAADELAELSVTSAELPDDDNEAKESGTVSVSQQTAARAPDLPDLREAYRDLVCAPQVTYEDIVSVHGKVSCTTSEPLAAVHLSTTHLNLGEDICIQAAGRR